MAQFEIVDDPSRNLRIITVRGNLTHQDVFERSVENCQGENPPLCVIWDFTEAQLTEIDSEGLREVARALKEVSVRRAGGKDAAVSTGDLEFGMVRVAEALAQIEELAFEVGSFRSREEAERWIFG